MLDLLHYNIHCLDIQICRLQITTIKCDQINGVKFINYLNYLN